MSSMAFLKRQTPTVLLRTKVIFLMKTDLPKRLRASIKFDAVNGNADERNVCKSQMLEAAALIEQLIKLLTEMEAKYE